jgi:hypothetical protein
MIKDRIILFFYVDDIIVAYYKKNFAAATKAVNMLKEKYTLTRGDDLQWFLCVEIIRLRD